jgi:hypothetical protein
MQVCWRLHLEYIQRALIQRLPPVPPCLRAAARAARCHAVPRLQQQL